jgi:hypothetical protein
VRRPPTEQPPQAWEDLPTLLDVSSHNRRLMGLPGNTENTEGERSAS